MARFIDGSSVTNSQGQVSTRVIAGNVPTSVRVTAITNTQDGTEVKTQSDLLTVNTGLPDQNSFTLSPSVQNPEAFNIDGQEVTVVARLADTFNNPVPDGTSVSFTTEGGSIEPSCNTVAGACSVTWTSSEPRVDNHRITILATAIGHETLFDANGNNFFDDDGPAILDNAQSGFGSSDYGEVGFVDMSEAWRDDNENLVRDASEIFLDFDADGEYDIANSLFNGPHCVSNSNCGERSLHVRKAIVLVTSSSTALLDVQTGATRIASNYQSFTSLNINIARGDSRNFVLLYSDNAELTDPNGQSQPIAAGSQVQISASSGAVEGDTNFTMPSTAESGKRPASFTLINSLGADDESVNTTVTATITSPSGVTSSVSFVVSLL